MLGALLRVLDQLGGQAAVVLVGRARGWRVPAIGREITLPAEQLHHRLGRRADDRELRVAHEVHVRARVHLAQHAVHVERVGVELEVVALGEHHLEDVAGDDVLLGDLDGPLVHARRPSTSAPRGSSSPATGGSTGAYASGRPRSATACSHARDRGVVRGVELVARRGRASARSRSGTPAGASGRTPPASRSRSSPRRAGRGRRAGTSGRCSTSRITS